MMTGYGVYQHETGTVYKGLWLYGLQHGTGHETWSDGSDYVGNYHFGVKHGEGVYTWSDKTTYFG